MSEAQNSYRQLMKATSIFGGVQVFQIIISIIRSKFIAVLLGPTGMGINSLLNTTTNLIAGMTNFGLETSAIKNVAAAYATGDNKKIAEVVGVMRRLVWFTGLLGALITLIFSPWLSELTFGNRNYTYAFIWISITLLLNQISSGQSVILRGTRRLKLMAQASLTGSFLGLIFSVPIYYKWGVDGIVPAIIVSSIVSLFRTWYFSRKVNIKKVEITRQITFYEGKEMLIMGFILSMSGLLSTGSNFFLRSYISNIGGVEQVGLYSAGFAIITTYVGMIFNAMSTDYYPRLSGIANDNKKSRVLINQQSEIAVLIIVPLLLVMIILIPFVIKILYSNKFLPVINMMRWAMLGLIFKASSWSIGFIYIAKGDSKIFFVKEILSISYLIVFSVLFFNLYGLTGLGVGFLCAYILSQIQTLILTYYLYNFYFEKNFLKIFFINILFAIAVFLIIITIEEVYGLLTATIITFVSVFYSYKELDKRMDLKSIFISIKKRFK